MNAKQPTGRHAVDGDREIENCSMVLRQESSAMRLLRALGFERVAGSLRRVQRVAKAGYIEVPDALFERINPLLDHHLEITQRNGQLVIRKKPAPVVDHNLVELYEDRAKEYVISELFVGHPFAFHVRYYWRGKINFVVVNPEIDAAWSAQESEAPKFATSLLRSSLLSSAASAIEFTQYEMVSR
jgi:hypothetical protein